ncbi:MAG TPA: uroporphyrinogen-III C-methyltransferase, partial [Terriglobales bacterium]|nr:uroporphyrinogen-III C-methyltransferase [Terriglobales bacterium]
ELLQRAAVIVYDRLVNPVLLFEASPAAIKIFVGKQTRRHCIAQTEINHILIGYARLGRDVVRLKGGDPFVFGRGGEEAEALADAGIPFELVPGVTSAVAVPAYAGIPLTHRNFASSFAVVTGHQMQDAPLAIDWAKLATAVDTLVILMGMANLPRIVERLIAHGRSPQTPAAVIRWGTTPQQATVIGRLADIAEKAAFLESPAVIVVGDVASLAQKLTWFSPGNRQQAFSEFEISHEPARP